MFNLLKYGTIIERRRGSWGVRGTNRDDFELNCL
jgi:hypothetical protein